MLRTTKLMAVISMVLAMLLFLEVPVGAVAPVLADDGISDTTVLEDDINDQSESEGVIISEIEDKRTENSKTFRMSDGTNMVAQYNLPVHYKNSKGDWVDYDNSLQSTEQELTGSDNAAATLDSVETFSTANASAGRKTVKKQMYKNRKSNSNVAFAQESSEDNMVLVKHKKHTVSWGYKGINTQRARYKEKKEERTGNDKFTVLDNLTSTVEYKSAYKNVDIQCITTPIGVKENIILNKKSATNKFVTTYDIGELRAEKLNDREIALYNSEDKIEYCINALYMFDANNETSQSIVLNVLENKNGKLTVELVADEQWLNSPDRAYPVTIDPSIHYGQKKLTVDTAFVDSTYPDDVFSIVTGTMYTGTINNSNHLSLAKLNSLPELNKGDMIVDATVSFAAYNFKIAANTYVGVYEVEDSWSQGTVTWNNKPHCSDLLIDYFNTDDLIDNNGCYDWNITTLIKKWYNGEANNGFYLKLANNFNQDIGFYSSNNEVANIRPTFVLTYLNSKGIESRWSYTSFSVGNVGTAHINDYSGALTFELPIASTADPYMSASVSYIYNSYMANTKYSKNAPYFGDGWRMNMQQTVLPSSNFGLTGEDAEQYPYVYTDADGTDHYFYAQEQDDGSIKYIDEEGLDLELEVFPNEKSTRYVITDKDKNKWYFYRAGLLNRYEDPYGNMAKVKYYENSTEIDYIQDTTDNRIDIIPNTDKYVNEIKDPAGRTTVFEYDSGNRVTKVTYPDGRIATFTYDDDGLIKTISDNGEYKIKFTYDDKDTKAVTAVQEYGKNNTEGQKITFDRTNYNETIIRSPGINGVYDTNDDNDDCITTCQFDNWGRLTGAHSKTAAGSDMGAEHFTYTSGTPNSSGSNIKTLNKVSKHHSLGQNAVNYLKDTSLEAYTNWTSSSVFGSAEYSTGIVNTQKIFGQKSMKINVTSYTDHAGGRRYQDVTDIPKGNYYTVSGYIKVTQISQQAEDNSGAFICATVYEGDGKTDYFSEYITEVTDTSINDGWRRVRATFNFPKTASKFRITLGLRGAVGTAYFDAVQVEYGKNVSAYNMVQNSSFEYYSNNVPTYWSNYKNLTFGDEQDGISTIRRDGSSAFRIIGDITKTKSLYQEIPVSGEEADTYILSGWAKTHTAIPLKGSNRFRLSVHVVYSDDSTKVKDPPCYNTSITTWQFLSYAFTLSDGTSAEKTPVAIRVFLTYSQQANNSYFDDIQLIKEPAQSYTYDEEGNLISVVATAQQNSSYEYNADKELESYTDPKGFEYSYSYNDQGSLTGYTNASGTKSTFSYDRGFLNSTATISGKKNKIESYQTLNVPTENSSAPTETPTYTIDSIDQSGNTTTSIYDSKKGTLQSVSDDKGTVSYTYNDANDTLQSVTQTEKRETNTQSTEPPESSTVEYDYYDETLNLKSIKTPSNTTYNFTYDAFGNPKSTQVGNNTLIEYTYEPNNGPLKRLDYGNGKYVTYTYDKYGNIRAERVNGTLVYEGLADKTGAITKAIDQTNKLQYNYVYDSTDRLVSSTRTDTTTNTRVAMFEYDFDLNNNLTKFASLTPHGSNVTQHTYGADNLPATSTFSNGTVVTHSYNTVSQPNGVSINTATPISVAYNYKRWRDDEKTYDNITDLIETEIEDAENFGFRYIYDAHNNITEIYDNVKSYDDKSDDELAQTYQYDYLDQLIEAIDYKDKKRYKYTYDNGGNITEEKVYDISENNDILLKTITYTYDTTSGWGDLLTSYVVNDETHTITYASIGNPKTYRDGIEFTWSKGRQLDSYTKKDGETVNYTYDTDGMRLSKTVDGVKHTYLYENGLLVQETRGDKIFDYSYDANGSIRMLKYRANASANPSYFYYALNSRGDVIGLYNSSGTLSVKYAYDPWGNTVSITDGAGHDISSTTGLAVIQPFRYRGYYYDMDSGFYYLQSRYYDPVTHRFINADNVVAGIGESVKGYNLFAYCMNNPVNQTDSEGNWPKWAKKLVVAAAIVATVAVVAAVTVATAGAGTAIAAIAVGAAKGAAIGFAVGAATGAVTGAISNRVSTGTWKGAGNSALNGMANGALSGAVSGAVTGGLQGYSSYYTPKAQTGACFVAGTLVLTSLGSISIENIEIGDLVWSEDPETRQKELKAVVQTFANETSELIRVYVNGEEIITTPEHPFYVPKKGWVSAVRLRAGDRLVLQSGEYVVVEKIQHEILETPVKVYNFEVDDFHTYYVGRNSILVHNKCILERKGVRIDVRTSNEHGLPHAHVSGNGPNTTIGLNGKPMKNHPLFSKQQSRVINANWEEIKNGIISIFPKK